MAITRSRRTRHKRGLRHAESRRAMDAAVDILPWNVLRQNSSRLLAASCDGEELEMTSNETVISDSAAPGLLSDYPVLVLLVDDQKMGRGSRPPCLGRTIHIEFHYCANPGEAVSVARKLKPTVILQDLVMPDVDGLDLVREYRAESGHEGHPDHRTFNQGRGRREGGGLYRRRERLPCQATR